MPTSPRSPARGRSLAGVKGALAAIIAQHADAGHVLDRRHPAIARVRAGIARLHARPLVRARALGLDELARIVAPLESGDLRALRDRALLLVGFFGALRRSELVALDVAGSMPRDVARGPSGDKAGGRSSIEITPEGLRIHITGSQGFVRHADHRRAPAWRRAVPGERRSPTIWRQRRSPPARCSAPSAAAVACSIAASTPRAFATSCARAPRRPSPARMRRRLAARLDRLSPHSLRAGLITAAAAHGAPEHAIQVSSRHASPAVLRTYIRPADAFAAGVGAYLKDIG